MYRKDIKIIWNPFDTCIQQSSSHYSIMILNTPISLDFQPSFILNLWNRAIIRATVDGGTDRWLTWLKGNNLENAKIAEPNLITGDFDSVSEDTLKYFVKKTSTFICETPDQNETDFTKALKELERYMIRTNLKADTVIVLGDTCGRLDQILANMNTHFKAREILPELNLFQLASNSLTWLLTEGNHFIKVPAKLRKSKEWCALMPIGSPCRVTTSGLKWNLDNDTLEFGKLVSTSNTYNGDPIVSVQTDNSLIWSMGIESLIEEVR